MRIASTRAWIKGALICAALLALPCVAQSRQRIVQLAEDGVQTRRIAARPGPLADAPVTRVCESGARWLRLDFSELTLRSYDTLVLSSSGGDRFVFQGAQWNQRSFTTRAFRGSCIDIRPSFGSPQSRYRVGSYQFGVQDLEDTPVVVAGAGDICDPTPADCGDTADLIVDINPTAVFTAGDNAYHSGTLTQYNTLYDPNWGRFKALTNPTPGNHDYFTTGASGYFDYFNGPGNASGPAGDRSKGYYSYDVGEWHFVALNTMSGGAVASAQLTWLEADLAATSKPCVAAYFHHPLVSRGVYHGYAQVKPIFDRLYAAKADLVMVGHDHNYQRYARMDGNQAPKADGLRQIVVGTGGRNLYGLSGTHPLMDASQSHTWGVLRLSLTANGYTGTFLPVPGDSWTDTFSGLCNAKGTGYVPPTTYGNATDFAIADNATIESPIVVTGRSGNAPAYTKVSVAIEHTFIGDLKVELVAPDNTPYVIHNRTGASADNLNLTLTLDVSREVIAGTWKLRVNDNSAGDTGRIDSWSITF
ncbi:proprotein convertase P-domain-containing protein [Agrilutibacter solisilvae]|uniref:Proprotein convertase P-domain-containing protein n=1 Tax=Agrilutibacter solisilvae TaxID=2763317 RepID=A0A975ATG6_9GAMM|nr:proprotein convertase P-domain-containing protein [Lysobacter solisilvae]QSX79089.1 proprotein convertase P-domain-containing protein [Lysobacter solisilvae]